MIDEWMGLQVAGIFFNSPLLTNKNMLPIVIIANQTFI